jgi:antitoxin component of MazEF toxin-antitoxin module
MKTNLIQIGNSKAIRIPDSLIQQYHLEGHIDLVPSDKGLMIVSSSNPRARWEVLFKDSMKMYKESDSLDIRKLVNSFDKEEWS